uniref:Uncharacterized protein n=1 Tax=Aotus nancymaae TaxID=37293 RepID=A0A2K5CQZ3_AOTNA
MRRSAAPSQLQGNSFKKPKFIPPGRSNPGLNEEITKLNPDIKLFEPLGRGFLSVGFFCSLMKKTC